MNFILVLSCNNIENYIYYFWQMAAFCICLADTGIMQEKRKGLFHYSRTLVGNLFS